MKIGGKLPARNHATLNRTSPWSAPPRRRFGPRRLGARLLASIDVTNSEATRPISFGIGVTRTKAAPGRRGPKRRQGGALQGDAPFQINFEGPKVTHSVALPTDRLSPRDGRASSKQSVPLPTYLTRRRRTSLRQLVSRRITNSSLAESKQMRPTVQ